MTSVSANRASARLFGIPVGDFGAFATVLISASAGVLTFFLVTFVSIFGIMIYDYGFGHHVTFAASYKWFALPAGILVMLASLIYLGSLWLRRKFRGESV
jgi:hypothetical protein